MTFFVYILYSPHLDKFYIGHTQDLKDRLYRHNNSGSRSTKKSSDWRIVYSEEFVSRSDAYQRELQIKRVKSRKYIEQFIVKYRVERPDA